MIYRDLNEYYGDFCVLKGCLIKKNNVHFLSSPDNFQIATLPPTLCLQNLTNELDFLRYSHCEDLEDNL